MKMEKYKARLFVSLFLYALLFASLGNTTSQMRTANLHKATVSTSRHVGADQTSAHI